VEGYMTTAMLTWDKYNHKDVAGYAIFRKEAGGKYPAEPVWTTMPDALSTTVMFNDYNLETETTYVYKIATYNQLGLMNSRFSKEVRVTTLPADALVSRVANLRVLFAIYTKGLSQKDIDKHIQSFRVGVEFFYRNSKGRLNLEPTFIFLDGDYKIVNGDHMLQFERDLKARGVQNNQFDGFYLIAKKNLPGFYGGYRILGNTYGGLGFATGIGVVSPYLDAHHRGELMNAQIWIFVHEFGHALDALSNNANPNEVMLFNHPPWAYPLPKGYDVFDAGEQFDVMAEILRSYNGYDKYQAPHDGYIEFWDRDGDGMADSDMRLPMDERRFGSNPLEYDSDHDGLSDLEEYYAGIYASSDPNNPDTNGNGIPDGEDPTPLCDFSPVIRKFSTPPALDGNIGSQWTRLASQPSYQSDKSLQAVFYAGWDDNYLYMAVESSKKIKLWLSLDGSGQNGRFETDGVFEGFTSWSLNKHSPTAYGDCYSSEAVLVIDPDSKAIQKREITNLKTGDYGKYRPVADSQVVYLKNGNTHTMMFRVPRALGPGIGYSYWKTGTPVTDGLQLEEGRVLGFQLTYAPRKSAMEEFSGDWSSINEVHAFYKSTLVK